jgi:hypothetical protein
MSIAKDSGSGQFKRNILVGYGLLVAVGLGIIIVSLFTNVFETKGAWEIPQIVWLIAAGMLLFMLVYIISKISKVLDVIEDSSSKLERIAELLEKNRSVLQHVDEGIGLSETARAILNRDADRERLRDAVLEKLQLQGLDAARELIQAIGCHAGYEEFARQLSEQVSGQPDSAEKEKAGVAAQEIEKLMESNDWIKASMKIEELIGAYPNSEEAKSLRQNLSDRKDARKKLLLTAWDNAVQRGATDRSLEILKELDQYLTPNEALALQESARDVFKTKLHNLGVQFSMAISGKNWAHAVEIGRQITRDFPNSKMAGEIRERMDVLKQKVGQESA